MPQEPMDKATLLMILQGNERVKATGLSIRYVEPKGAGFLITAKNDEGDTLALVLLPRSDGEPWVAPEVVEESVNLVEDGALRVRAARQGLVLPDEKGRFPEGGVIR